MMSDSAEEEINRRLALLPTVLQSLDRKVKVALVQNDFEELDSFPTTEHDWDKLGRLCNLFGGNLVKVKNRITALQTQSPPLQTSPPGK